MMGRDNMSEQLKPCECGGEAVIDVESIGEYSEPKAEVYCKKCGKSTGTYLLSSAITAWNTRATN
jgi:hypothetical protein